MTFDKAFDLLMRNEGGYSNHASDKGGETRYGISKARYPNEDIKNLTLDRAKFLAKRDFWDEFRCGEMPWPIAWVLFDCVFNHHPRNPIRWLQTALGVTIDGKLGNQTVGAANSAEEPLKTACAILQMRMQHFKKLSDWPVFGGGWAQRVIDTMAGALDE